MMGPRGEPSFKRAKSPRPMRRAAAADFRIRAENDSG